MCSAAAFFAITTAVIIADALPRRAAGAATITTMTTVTIATTITIAMMMAVRAAPQLVQPALQSGRRPHAVS